MAGSALRTIGKLLLLPVLALAVLVYGYGSAAAVGGLIPANPDWRPPAHGIRIFVEDNGVHTGLVLPVRAAGIDWRDLAAREPLRNPAYAAQPLVAFGWGDRDFYRNTPRWRDLSVTRTLAALAGVGDTVVHVEHIAAPAPDARAILLRPEEYRRLAAFIRASFANGGTVVPGYGAHDAFHPGTGDYNGFNTCNEWTGRALRAAGVRVGAWTPLSWNVMLWF